LTTKSNKQDLAALPFWRRAAIILYRASRWLVHTGITCITLLVVLILLASAFSDLISPTVWIVAAYLGLFFPFILIGNLLWLGFLLLTRRWHMVWMVLAVLSICSFRIWRYCPLNFTSNDAITNVMVENGVEKNCPIDSFRVMTFNTRGLGDGKVGNIKTELPIIDMVRDCGADLVCLQEYTFSKSAKGHTEESIRKSLQKQYPYYHLLLNNGSKTMGIAIYSKWPIKTEERIDKSEKYCWANYYELEVRGRRIALVNCHLQNQAISKENRSLYKKQVKHFDTDSLRKMDDGLRELGPSFRNRTKQVATINQFLTTRRKKWQEPMPMLICGDLNDTPASFTYRSLRGDLDDTWREAGFGPGITYREAPFWFRIDHIFHSEDFRVLDVQVLKEMKCSDHYPVLATFQLLPTNE